MIIIVFSIFAASSAAGSPSEAVSSTDQLEEIAKQLLEQQNKDTGGDTEETTPEKSEYNVKTCENTPVG